MGLESCSSEEHPQPDLQMSEKKKNNMQKVRFGVGVPQCLVKGASLLCWGLEESALGACSKPENRQRKEQQRQKQNL